MSVENWRLRILGWGRLVIHNLTRIVLMNTEPILRKINREGTKFGGDGAVGPSSEDATPVGAEGDYVAEHFEARKRFVDCDVVPVAMAFDGGGEAGEAGAYDYDGDAGWRFWVRHLEGGSAVVGCLW